MSGTAIFFDLDGTLVQLDRPYEAVVAAALEEHLGRSTPALVETYDEAFLEAFDAMDPAPFRTGMEAVLAAADIDEAGADNGDHADVDPGDADPDAMVATLREAEFDALSVDPAVPDSLEGLGDDAALGVLTDGVDEWQRAKLERVGLAGYFDAVVTSYEAGAHKPDPAVFELAAERLPAAEYAMVGDDDADVEGARAAGWVPIRYEEREAGPPFWETVGALL